MSFFETTKEFDSAISEIDYLISMAAASQSSPSRLNIYIKSSIVLLATKLESFAENILEEFIDRIKDGKIKHKHLPEQLRIHSTDVLLKELSTSKAFTKKQKSIDKLHEAARIWKDEEDVTELTVSYKFDYGKHGSIEFKKFFNRIGIEDICDVCQITSINESMIDTGNQKRNISGDIDSLTHIRNNIVHTDAIPAGITFQQITGYRQSLWEFCFLIDLHLENQIRNILSNADSR